MKEMIEKYLKNKKDYKFRAYDLKEMKWISKYEDNGMSLYDKIYDYYSSPFRVITSEYIDDNCIIMRSIGNKDINNTELFEGDITKSRTNYYRDYEEPHYHHHIIIAPYIYFNMESGMSSFNIDYTEKVGTIFSTNLDIGKINI